ncbi:hypothetical protein MTO96_027518 [Rhipicephalus appendiculatus]
MARRRTSSPSSRPYDYDKASEIGGGSLDNLGGRARDGPEELRARDGLGNVRYVSTTAQRAAPKAGPAHAEVHRTCCQPPSPEVLPFKRSRTTAARGRRRPLSQRRHRGATCTRSGQARPRRREQHRFDLGVSPRRLRHLPEHRQGLSGAGCPNLKRRQKRKPWSRHRHAC